jgi:hypothetical protein
MPNNNIYSQRHVLSKYPLGYALAYFIFTYALFLFAPFRWQIPNQFQLFLILFASMILFVYGYLLGIDRRAIRAKKIPVKAVAVVGGLLSFIMLFPSAQIYTGRWPWEVLDALFDQKEAYQGLGEQLRQSAGERGYISAARAVVAPLAFAAIVIGFLNWRSIGKSGKIGILLAITSSLVFSILRGTNKEVVEMSLVLVSVFSIAKARKSIMLRENGSNRNIRSKNIYFYFGVCIIFIIVLATFIARISGRLGNTDVICMGTSGICSDFNGGIYPYLPDFISQSIAIIGGYLGQGYFGLSLALQEPFSSGYGLAHSPAISTLFIMSGGDESLIRETYPYRLLFRAWDPEVQWTSMITWLAADVGFPGAVVAVGVLGYALSRGWKSAVVGQNDIAACILVIAILTCFYFPANFQATVTFDSYITLISVVIAYKIWRIR